MTKEKTQIKVGIFVFIGLLLAMYIIFMIGGESQLFKPQYELKTTFKDISGLRIGAPVQLAGLKVGFVDVIKFSPELTQKDIEIVIRIDKKFQDRIRKDSVAIINTQGLLGDKFVYISVGSEGEPVLKDGEDLQSKETVSIFGLAEKGGEIIEDVREASHSASRFFKDMYEGRENISAALKSMKDIAENIEKGEGLIHALIYDPKGKEVVADLASSLDMLESIIGRVNKTDEETGEVSGLLKNMRAASAGLKDIVERVNRGEGTIGGLLSDPAIYNDLRSLFGRMNRNKLFKTLVRSTLAENDKNVLKP